MTDYLIIGADYDGDYLAHYGVVGMRWHHRKASSYAAKGNMKKAQKHLDKNIKNQNKVGALETGGNKYTSISNNDVTKAARRNKMKKIALGTAVIAGGSAYLASRVVSGKGPVNERIKEAARQSVRKGQPNYTADAERTARNAVKSVRDTTRNVNDKVNNARATAASHHTSSASSASYAQLTSDRLRAYQEAINRASGAADNARNKAYNAGKKKRK